MFSSKKKCRGTFGLALIVITIATISKPIISNAQNIDSLGIYLSQHLTDTSALRNIAIKLQLPALMGSAKADSLAALIKIFLSLSG
mgnify:CR=1 FL=1